MIFWSQAGVRSCQCESWQTEHWGQVAWELGAHWMWGLARENFWNF